MTLWWMIVGAAGLFLALILVLRAWPVKPGYQATRKATPGASAKMRGSDTGTGLPVWHMPATGSNDSHMSHGGHGHAGGAGDSGSGTGSGDGGGGGGGGD